MDFQWTGEREETLLNTLPAYHHHVTKDMLMSEICKEIGCDRKSFHEIVFLCTMHFLSHRFFPYVVPYIGFDCCTHARNGTNLHQSQSVRDVSQIQGPWAMLRDIAQDCVAAHCKLSRDKSHSVRRA